MEPGMEPQMQGGMEPYGEAPSHWTPRPPSGPPPRARLTPRWLILGGLALAFALTLGIGALVGAALHSTANAASFVPSSGSFAQNPGARQFPLAGTPGAQGQCDVLTVTSVSGQTIVATAQDGTSVTIHTSASTTYTHAGQAATASAVTVGSHIHVQGTHNSDGSIAATSIDVQ